MNGLIKLAGGVALAAFVGNAALAADAVEAPPAPPVAAPVQITPATSWSGIYVGGFGGYNWGDFDSTQGNINADGWNGGAFAGYNWQSGPLVFGAEADIGYSGASGRSASGVTADQKAFGSLRGRVGYAFDPLMIYGTGGLAITGTELSQGGTSDSNTLYGWTAGGGAEALITENVFGRLEYRYSDYGSKTYSTGLGNVSSGFTTHSVNAGIGLKF